MSDIKRLSPQRTIRMQNKHNYYETQTNDTVVFDNIRVGIVVAVDYYGNEKTNTIPYSLKIRIETDFSSKVDSYYPPLLPVHNISLPQVGEEVWVLLTDSTNIEKGFWISRLNYDYNFSSNKLSQYSLNSQNSAEASKQIYTPGLQPDDLKETYDVEPKTPYKIPKLRIKPGDVFVHGRSNTHIINTFDTVNKKGVIDIVTEIDKEKQEFYKQEFHISKGARNLLVTKHNLDEDLIKKDMNLKFHNNYNKVAPQTQEESFGLLTGDQVRLLSSKGGPINHAVLGEKQAEWLEKIIKLTETFIEKVTTLNTKVDVMNTAIQSLTVATAVGPSSPPVNVANFVQLTPDFATLKQDLSKLKTDFDNEIKTITDHHSKNIGLN